MVNFKHPTVSQLLTHSPEPGIWTYADSCSSTPVSPEIHRGMSPPNIMFDKLTFSESFGTCYFLRFLRMALIGK